MALNSHHPNIREEMLLINEPGSIIEEEEQSPAHGSLFRQGVLFNSGGSLLNIIFLFLETIVAVRLLSPESYGIYVLLIVVVNFLVTAVDFGFKTAVTRFIAGSDHDQQAALAHSSLLFRLLVLAVITLVIWISKDILLLLDSSGEVVRYAAYIPIMVAVASVDELFLAMLQGFRHFKAMAIDQIGRSLLRLSLSLIFLTIFDLGTMALILSWIISFTLSVIYQFFVLPIPKRVTWQHSKLPSVLRFGFPLQLNRLLWYVSSRVDVLLLGVFAGPTGVAFYNIAATIPSALIRLAQSYIAVFFPTMASLISENKRRQANWMLDHSLRLCSFVGALGAIGAVVFSKEIITILFSEKYANSSMAFALLMLAFHMTLLVNLTGYTLTAAGFPKRSLVQDTTNVVFGVIGDLLLIPKLGYTGAALANMISSYAANPVAVWLLWQSNLRLRIKGFAKQIALLWFCVALFWFIQPTGFIYKIGIILVFIVLNCAFSTISVEDLNLVLPDILIKRLSSLKDTLHRG
jgi:O-antigen/teichoic acid export membrane protein